MSKLQEADNALEGVDGVEALRDQIAALQAEVLQKSKDGFKEVAKQLFAKYPALESFSWTQYSPYFNDGEECVFGVHAEPDYGVEINGTSPEGDGDCWSYETDRYGYYNAEGERVGGYVSPSEREGLTYQSGYVNKDPELDGALDEVCRFINALDESAMQSMFGNHVKVIVSRDKVEVEDYSDHD